MSVLRVRFRAALRQGRSQAGPLSATPTADERMWAQLSAADTVEVCKHAIAGELSCTDTGAAYIMGLAEDSGTVTISARSDTTTQRELITLSP
ncbi:MAG: hypothetical protein P8R54_14245 [Myxococcota bacterium]|nr:hypothetical protein [Myxococcota bacterium]